VTGFKILRDGGIDQGTLMRESGDAVEASGVITERGGRRLFVTSLSFC